MDINTAPADTLQSELQYAQGNAQNARERFQNAPTLKARRLAAEDLEFWTNKSAMLYVMVNR